MQTLLPFMEDTVRTVRTLAEEPDLDSYDLVIVMFSGGKDSVASTLLLLERGIRPELWHHDVDGQAGDFFDWPITIDYCRKFADHFGLPFYLSYRVGGLKRELLKQNDRTAPIRYETPDGFVETGGKNGKISTRRRFPQPGADLRTRWCSPLVKIDVASAALAGQDRFKGKRTLVVTGERAQESSNRARYATFEPHRNHAPGKIARRHVDHWRPIHGWTEDKVWDIIRRHRVNPHPSYLLGFGRTSCLTCVFGSKNQWASVRALVPGIFGEIADLETEFGWTIHRTASVTELADAGRPYEMDPRVVELALSKTYDDPIIVDEWKLPAGAFGEGCGPS